MIKKRVFSPLVVLVLALTHSIALAQSGSNIISSSRRIDWSQIGAGTIPTNRTQCGATINAYNGSATTINNAIANCGTNQYVQLGAGTFNLTSAIIFDHKNNVSLKGMGSGGVNETELRISADVSCQFHNALVCLKGGSSIDGTNISGSGSLADWTAGYSPGTTTITIGANLIGSQKPTVGSLMFLDQKVDGTTYSADTFPEIFSCTAGGHCSQDDQPPATGRGSGATAREQFQIVKVTSVSAGSCPCQVGISPGLYMPNWRSDREPQAWYSNSPSITGVGVEDLHIYNGVGWTYIVEFSEATASWVKNVQIDGDPANPAARFINFWHSWGNTVRDSYIFGQSIYKDAYGINCYACGGNLIENNIIQNIRAPFVHESGFANVFAYNYVIHNIDPTGWRQPGLTNHGGGANFWLAEGNDIFGLGWDNYYGGSNFLTAFRNRFWGQDQYPGQNQTVPAFNYAMYRFNNIIGNVLGTVGYHNTYETTDLTSSTSNCNKSIFAIGLGGNCEHDTSPPDDPRARQTLFRWGNWDTVTGASGAKFNSAEVPSTLTKYANPVPANQTLPFSLYLTAKPAFWPTEPAWPLPMIGPDVNATGSNALPNSGGHAYRIPARRCFEDVMHGTFGDLTPRSFNAKDCYSTTVNPPGQPNSPLDLRVSP